MKYKKAKRYPKRSHRAASSHKQQSVSPNFAQPSHSNTERILQLQRTIGNQATIRLLQSDSDTQSPMLQRWLNGIIPGQEAQEAEPERQLSPDELNILERNLKNFLSGLFRQIRNMAVVGLGNLNIEPLMNLMNPYRDLPGVSTLLDATRQFFNEINTLSSVDTMPDEIAALLQGQEQAYRDSRAYAFQSGEKRNKLAANYKKSLFKNKFSEKRMNKKYDKLRVGVETNDSKYAQHYQKLVANSEELKVELGKVMRSSADFDGLRHTMESGYLELIGFIKEQQGVDRLRDLDNEINFPGVDSVMRTIVSFLTKGQT